MASSTQIKKSAPGRFGPYGGRYVPETLMAALEELERTYAKAKGDRKFQRELDDLRRTYAGRPTPLFFARQLTRKLGEHFDALLLDSAKTGHGGSGRTFDWEHAGPLIRLLGVTSKLIVAGGLGSENVGAAIAKFHPYGVDAVTGVEIAPGKKDHMKLKEFVSAAKSAVARGTADSSLRSE